MIRYIYILTLLLSLSYNATHFLKVNHTEDVRLDFENRSLQYLENNKSLFGINNLQEELIIRDISNIPPGYNNPLKLQHFPPL